MKHVPIFSFFALFLMCITLSAESIAPNKCPSQEQIVNTTFSRANFNEAFKMWYVMQTNQKYDTNVAWDFGIMVNATNKEEAISKAKIAVTTLKTPSGPAGGGGGHYMCEYQLPSGPEAIAFFPSGFPKKANEGINRL